jgi:hypothetical protein
MFKRVLKLLLGIFIIPVCIGVSLGLYEQLSRIKAISYYHQKYFVLGIVAYLVVHAVIFKPSYLYIFSHEFMHAIATWISGGKVTSFKVSSKGGSVAVTKNNLFIALAPYFFPFYTIVVTLIFFTAKFFLKDSINYNPFLFAIGFALAFHIILTVDFLKIRQTDLMHAGYLFSICLIYIVNLIIIGLIFSLLFGGVTFKELLMDTYFKSKDIYAGAYRQLFL